MNEYVYYGLKQCIYCFINQFKYALTEDKHNQYKVKFCQML
jgi:hypothetical protein